ncbi:hypothetical protein [Streptomyces albicerus]|jgi:hypothetical protein|uniref:hypothetical protein n=1 Tax=Streptomyces albicerus TaxID=2569859 RepID=UPI00124BBBDD|nr:hypothetical protein [Streptomyces albicerus]
MRKFQRVAVVAAAIAGLSTIGAGVSFAHGEGEGDGFDGVTAVASSQANAVANYGGTPHGHGRHGGPQAAPHFAPQNGFNFAPTDIFGHGSAPHGS